MSSRTSRPEDGLFAKEEESIYIVRRLGKEGLAARWRPDLLGGVITLSGRWSDGGTLLAVPHFARMNRAERPVKFAPGGPVVDYAPGATGVTLAASQPKPSEADRRVVSQVWINA